MVPTELRHEIRRSSPVLVAVPLLTLVVWAAGTFVVRSQIDAWDLHAIDWFVQRRTPWLTTATFWGTYAAETIPVIAILLIAIVCARRWTHRWRTSLFLALVVGGEKVIYLVSSTLVSRDRPPVPALEDTYATSSFPSGHVGSAITLYGGIAIAVGAWRGRKHLLVLMTAMSVIACAVAFSRMYRGFHYPSDCIAGAFVGVTWMSLCVLAVRPIAPRTAAANRSGGPTRRQDDPSRLVAAAAAEPLVRSR